MKKEIEIQKIEKFGNMDIFARQVVEGYMIGLHKSPYHGFSVEFAEHRLYNQGESTRYIDWKLYAKTEKLFVKKYEEETNLRCQIVIDTSSSMFFPENNTKESPLNKIQFSVYSAAALIHLLQKQRDAFGLSLFDEELSLHTQNKTNKRHQRFLYGELEKLLTLSPQKKGTSTAKSIHQVASQIHQRSLVIIFTDLFGEQEKTAELISSLQHLKHNKHEVVLFHVVDSEKEIEFDFPNRPTHFIDTETDAEIKLSPAEIRQAYQKSIQSYSKEMKIKCGQYQIDFIEADIHQGFDAILTAYLLKRKRLY